MITILTVAALTVTGLALFAVSRGASGEPRLRTPFLRRRPGVAVIGVLVVVLVAILIVDGGHSPHGAIAPHPW